MDELTHFSLFSGIGGIDLAAEWAGFRTAGFVEQADYPVKVLQRHWPGVPIWRDVRDVTAESVRAAGIGPITLVSGGFPCQPFSLAGRREGKGDDRYLWPEMSRVIQELRPAWVLGENVAGFISLALEDVLSDLESQGYEARAFVLPACAVGAPHRRDRIFIVAHAKGEFGQWGQPARAGRIGPSDSSETLADTTSEGLEGVEWQEFKGNGMRPADSDWWATEPEVGRVANGLPRRVDRLRALGNAVVPAQVYPILKAIADWEIIYNPATTSATHLGAIPAPSPIP